MLERAEALERIQKVTVEKLKVSKDVVLEESSFQDDLGADSLDVVDLVIGFEEEFDIVIPDEDGEKIATVGQAVDYILEKTAG